MPTGTEGYAPPIVSSADLQRRGTSRQSPFGVGALGHGGLPPGAWGASATLRTMDAPPPDTPNDGQKPCEGCRHLITCRAGHLACAAARIYAAGDGGPDRWALAPRQPSREHWRALFPD